MKFEWETIYDAHGGRTERAKVMSGWLVRHVFSGHVSMVFIEDRHFSWSVD